MICKGLAMLAGFAVVAILAAVVGIAATRGAAAAPTSSQAPAWLQADVPKVVAIYSRQSAPITSVRWVLTTVGDEHRVVPDQGAADPSVENKACYVVVVDGSFTPMHSMPGVKVTAGAQMVLEYDPGTQAIVVLDILHTPIDPAAFGTVVNTMSL
jgi:hypothetical protein